MASCVAHGEWEPRFFACPKCFEGGDVSKPLYTQCPSCEGSGSIALGEHFVSREMALDACEPAMEGMSMGIEYGPCPDCSGGGQVPKEIADVLSEPKFGGSVRGGTAP